MAPDNPHPQTGAVNLAHPDFTACPHKVLAELRANFPVARAVGAEGQPAPTVVLAKYQDVIRALQDHETFSSDVGFGGSLSPAPVHVDPPEHARFRELLRPRFTTQAVSRFEPFVRSEANRLIDAFVERGACDYQKEFAVPLPSSLLLRTMGLPAEDLELLLAIKDEILHPGAGDHTTGQTHQGGVIRARAYFDKVIDDRARVPADDLLTDLARTTVEGEPQFTRQDIFRVCLNLLLGGLDTVTASLGCAMVYLARHSGQRARITGAGPVVARAARELMRFEAPVMVVPRTARRDVTIGGTEIRAGTLVMCLLGSASADEDIFSNPEQVDFDRHPNGHVAFGFGRHRCIGEHLGLMVLEVALDVWHRRIPDYAIRSGEPLEYNAVIRSPRRLPLEWDAGRCLPRAIS